MRPTEYMETWSLRDRGLAEALLIYERGLNRFGIPQHEAIDPANAGFFDVDDSTIDHSEAAYHEWQDNNDKPEPGTLPLVVLDTRAKASAAARRERRRTT